jgi:hypothetical protein
MVAIDTVRVGRIWPWPILGARLRLWLDGLRVRWHTAYAAWHAPQLRFSPADTKAPVQARAQSFARQEFTAFAALLGVLEWQFWAVLAVSAVIMLVLQAKVTFWYGGSDHADYLNYGYYLLGQLAPYALPQWRTPGMGIFHILSGTVLLDSWWGLRVLHAVMGIAIPALVYLTVRPFSRGFALVAGLVVILSMTPYIYAFQPLSDHLFYFLHALVLLLCVTYFVRRHDVGYKLPIAIAVVAAYLNLVRPVGAIIFWIFIVVALIARPRAWRRLVAACAVYLAIMAAWIVWDRDYGSNLGAMPGNFFPLPTPFTTTAERRLAEAYFSPAGLTHSMGEEAVYPHSSALRELLRRYLREHPESWQSAAYFTPHELFAAYAAEPDKLLDRLFADQNSLYFGFIVRSAQDALGTERGLALLHEVAAEHGTTGLRGWLGVFMDDPTRLLFGVLPKFSARMTMMTLYASPHSTMLLIGFPERMLTPDLGPATARLLEIMRTFMYSYPQYCRERTRFKNCPEDYYRAIVNEGRIDGKLNPDLMWQVEGEIWSVLTWYLGLTPSQRLYQNIDMEIIQRYPRIGLLFYDNLLHKTFVKNFGTIAKPTWQELAVRSDAMPPHAQQDPRHLTPGLAEELRPLATSDALTVAQVLHAVGFLAAPLFLLALVLALPFLLSPMTTVPAAFLILVYLQELASISLLSPVSLPRYEGAFYLLPFIIACMLLGHAYAARRRKKRRQAVASTVQC